MKNILTPRRVLAVAALVLLAWLLYPILFGKKAALAPEEVHVRLDAAPNNVISFLANGHAPSNFVSRQLFQTLGDLDPKTLEAKPMIITAIPKQRAVTDGPHKGEYAYDFELLPEAAWDNGSPVTANDVAFTFKIVFHPGLPEVYRSFYTLMSGMDIDPANPKKFTVYFSKFYILALEALCNTPIMPAYYYDAGNKLLNIPLADLLDTSKRAALVTDPNLVAFKEEFTLPKYANDGNFISGSGPYRLEVMNDQGAILVKKQNWWGDKLVDKYPMLLAAPKKIVYKVIKDDAAVRNMITTGEIDLVGGSIGAPLFLELRDIDSIKAKYDFLTFGFTQYNRWVLNHQNPILKDVKVRQALTHIADYDYFIKQVNRDMAIRITGPMPPDRAYYAKDLPLPDFNIAKAKQMLNDAGWTDSDNNGILDKVLDGKLTQLSFKLSAPVAYKANELIANSLKESARQAGIDLVIEAVDLATISSTTKTGNFDSALLGVAIFPGMVDFNQRFHSSSLAPAGDNRGRYISSRADKLIESIRVEPDDAKRNAMYYEIQKVFQEEIPEVVLYAPLQRIIISNKFEPGVASANRPGYYEHFARLRKN